MNQQSGNQWQAITALYWVLSESAIRGVLDHIRTILTSLVAEMQAATPSNNAVPTPAAADQAVNVVLHGAKRAKVTVNTSSSIGGESTAGSKDATPEASPFWTTSRRVVAAIVGLAGIISAAVAVAVWQGWQPC